MPATEFVGYNQNVTDAKVLAIVADDELQQTVGEGVDAILVLDKTTMYAEMGGQVAAHGVISFQGGSFLVDNVQKNKGGKYMHYGKITAGVLNVGDAVTVSIDTQRRSAVMRAHSATHLLQKALQPVLGDHVHQAGSFVEEDHLRFDFTHFSAMTAEEIEKVDALVQAAVLEGYGVDNRELSIAAATAMGATALFS